MRMNESKANLQIAKGGQKSVDGQSVLAFIYLFPDATMTADESR
jgi:hypothetical protein